MSPISHKSLVISLICVMGLGSWVLPAQVHKDSSLISGWAGSCVVERGYINISDTTKTDQGSNRASVGDLANASGPADGSIVSLGDGGTATYTLAYPLSDANGPDFAVFENGFREQMPPNLWFLELAVVEVSSDGQKFVRFPCISNTQSQNQVPTFGQLHPDSLHNLAGKYTLFNGTPFDLYELRDSSSVNIYNITHIRIIDVVGSLNENYGTKDSRGIMINDPYPTPFWSGGFDLDAVAFLGNSTGDFQFKNDPSTLRVFPNPVSDLLSVVSDSEIERVDLISAVGKVLVFSHQSLGERKEVSFDVSGVLPGLYFLQILTGGKREIKRLIIQ